MGDGAHVGGRHFVGSSLAEAGLHELGEPTRLTGDTVHLATDVTTFGTCEEQDRRQRLPQVVQQRANGVYLPSSDWALVIFEQSSHVCPSQPRRPKTSTPCEVSLWFRDWTKV